MKAYSELSEEQKEARRAATQRWRARNPERVRQRQREYYAANRESERERNRRWRAENPEKALALERRKHPKAVERHRAQRQLDPLKFRARWTLNNAIRTGKVDRPSTCSICNKTCTPEGHHHDYNRPLEVEWLCTACHIKAHWPTEGSSGLS